MGAIDISLFDDIHVSCNSVELTLENVVDNILKERWTFELDSKSFSVSKEYIEDVIFSVIRGISMINIDILDDCNSESRMNFMLNNEKKIAAILLYIKGIVPNKGVLINVSDIVKCVSDSDYSLFKESEFSLRSGKEILDITFKELSDDYSGHILKSRIPIKCYWVQGNKKDAIKHVRSVIDTIG